MIEKILIPVLDVRQIDGELRMYGTPWHGEVKFGSARGVKLKKIFFLRHGQKNAIQPLANAESVLRLLQCSFPPFWDAAGMEFTMALFETLAARISCDELSFRLRNILFFAGGLICWVSSLNPTYNNDMPTLYESWLSSF